MSQQAQQTAAGSLVVVGLGIAPAGQLTVEAAAWLDRADAVYSLLVDGPPAGWLSARRPGAIPLSGLPLDTAAAQLQAALAAGQRVCLVTAGHPLLPEEAALVLAGRVRQAGHEVWFTPAVSAEDCAYANLGLDPGRRGCQSFTATHWLLCRPRCDPASPLILWQLDRIGACTMDNGLALLAEQLGQHYPPGHPATLYEPGAASLTQTTLPQLSPASISPATLLYLPPLPPPTPAGGSPKETV